MKPSKSVLELVKQGRRIIGPINVGRAVRMWYVTPTIGPEKQKHVEIQLVDPSGDAKGPIWLYSYGGPEGSFDTLYRPDLAVF